MATKLTRAEKREINRARWAAGERWVAGDSGALTPAGNGHHPVSANGNGNGASSELEREATPAKRDNRWRSATNGSGGSVRRVYGLAAGERGGGRGSGPGARLRLAQQADTPEEAARLCAPLAWPCRCGRCLPERVGGGGSGWWGYRFTQCVKCGRDVL